MIEEKYGFRIGQKVRLVSGGGEYPLYGYSNGQEYTVYGFGMNGDVEECVTISGGCYHGHANKSQIEPVTARTKVTGPATITVASGETITFEGNATVKQDWVPKFGDRVTFIDPPEDMVGEFGVVLEFDRGDTRYRVSYNDGNGFDYFWLKSSQFKPYEAA